MKHRIASLLWIMTIAAPSLASPSLLPITSTELFTGKSLTAAAKSKKGVVVTFLSAQCPCSHSHLQELRTLAKDFSDYEFVAVHSNTDEDPKSTVAYFKENPLPFPILQDDKAVLANQYGANKTPHTFLVASNGDVAYQGGVSSSHDMNKAERRYLREALDDLHAGRSVRTPVARTLGCAIQR